MNGQAVTTEDRVLGGLALLLIVDLMFLPWFSLAGFTWAATSDPDGWTCIVAVLLAIWLLVDLAVERFAPQHELPAVNGSRTETRFFLACGAALFVAFKFLLHVHMSLFGAGFYAGVILAAALVFVAHHIRGGGGLPHLRR